ncbi:MAG TPA: glutathione S-transferase family protein [Candidatus Binataceae bacterium]|jgi:glutathione S-transferase|nr:glutathione S-transferase family protein [Candidatus Binataceae bacterium]
MLLYDSFGPNPRAMRMFMAEKGITLPKRELDIMGAENRRAPYTTANPGGQIPALELDNGKTIGETVAIFEYLEEKHPSPALIGSTPEERAETRQWQRRVELNITEHVYNGFRYAEGLELFKSRMPVYPEAAASLKSLAQKRMEWLNGLIAGRDWIVPNRFTIADIILYCCLDFAAGVGQKIPPSCTNLQGWFKRVEARPSATASLHPNWAKVKMRG